MSCSSSKQPLHRKVDLAPPQIAILQNLQEVRYWKTNSNMIQLAKLKSLHECRAFETGLVQPVITPRFVPSCTLDLLRGLGKLAQEHKVVIQSHISESLDEVAFCKALHPEVSHAL